MRSIVLAFPLTFLLAIGCLPTNARRNSGTGGQDGDTGGAGGSSGSGGSGGSIDSGGTTGSGGSSGDSQGGAGSGGEAGGGGSGGQAGNGGRGGADDAGLTSQPGDAAPEARRGTGGANGGNGGTTLRSGGAGGGGTAGGSAGRIGTGGSTGTGGATGTGGSTDPTPCSFPSNWTPAGATYTTYTLPNPSTACGYEGQNNTIKNIHNGGYFAAIPGNTSQDFNTRDRCGACVQIGNAIITIVDECPNDSNPPCAANPGGHLDLSNAGANAGSVRGDPAVRGQNQWKFVPCPINGNVVVRLKPGNNNEMFIENMILPIKAVTCAGLTGSRTFYGAWHFDSNIPGAECQVTDLANRTISVTAGKTQGENVDTGVQFPKCL